VILGDMSELYAGEVLTDFEAAPLRWDWVERRVDGVLESGEVDTALAPPHTPPTPPEVGSLWYNVPELDVTVAYAFESRDRTFADEQRRERGFSPAIQLSLEMPLDFYRSARSYNRQLEASRERRYLKMVAAYRDLLNERDLVDLTLHEASVELEVSRSRQQLADEDLRIARMKANQGDQAAPHGGDLALLDAELEVLEAGIELTRSRVTLTRYLIDYEVRTGRDIQDVLAELSGSAPASPPRTP
jgi:hypothetical protein